MPSSQRQRRVQELLKEKIGRILQAELRDPRLGLVTVTDVEVSPDLRHARVFVSVYGSERDVERSMARLKAGTGFVRRVLARSVELRFTPSITFIYDGSVARAARITTLLGEISKETPLSPNLMRETILQTISDAQTFVVASHENPDGDAVGAVLGLTLGLQQLGKDVHPLSTHPVPRMYRFLPGWEMISTTPPDAPFQVGIGVDCDGSARMATMESAILGAGVVIDIDHHKSAHTFGDLLLVDPSAAATCELIFDLLRDLQVTITPEIATCLYCGLGTDTGFFRFGNSSPKAFRAAADLVEAGADPALIVQKGYVNRPRSSLVLLGLALAGLSCYEHGAIAVGTLSLADFGAAGALSEESEGIIDVMKTCESVRVAILLREQENNGIRVSLRATDDTDVGGIAEEFGGGGHRAAAGCTLGMTLAEAEALLVPRVVQALRR